MVSEVASNEGPKEVSLTLTKLNLVTKLSEDIIEHHLVIVEHQYIGMLMGMQAILGIQALAKETMLELMRA